MSRPYQPKTGKQCHCKPGVQRSNCPECGGTGWQIDFAAIRHATLFPPAVNHQPNTTMTTDKPKTATVRMKKKRDCRGSVLFETEAQFKDLPALNTIYVNRTMPGINEATTIRVTLEIEA